MNLSDVSIIGTGALGSALAAALQGLGMSVRSIYNRTSSKSRILAEKLDVQQWGTFPGEAEELGRMIFLTVPDDSIAGVAEQLSLLQDDWSDHAVVHCSGSKPSAVLGVLNEKGAVTAAFHPLQTFTGASSPASFRGIYFSMEGNRNLLETLGELAERLEARTLEITAGGKRYLHAAAVMASNYLIALLHLSEQVAGLGGMDARQARRALLPLVRQSLEHAERGALSGALSGPVARGDSGTIQGHLELLEPDADLLLLYQKLGLQALKLAKQKGTLTPGQISELETLLST